MTWPARTHTAARLLSVWLLVPALLVRSAMPAPATTPATGAAEPATASAGMVADTAGNSTAELIQQAPAFVRVRNPADGYLVSWAQGRWHAAGLSLPPVDVIFHDRREGCAGHIGIFANGDRPSIHLCIGDEPLSVGGRKTVLHELGHAWAAAHLEDAERIALARRWERPGWNEPDLRWHERGSEVLAEVIAWGLMDRSLEMPALPGWGTDDLEREFTLVTGRRPLVPGIE